nr:MAG TPA: hypothetical protein [Caudoviricetes sp.]
MIFSCIYILRYVNDFVPQRYSEKIKIRHAVEAFYN